MYSIVTVGSNDIIVENLPKLKDVLNYVLTNNLGYWAMYVVVLDDSRYKGSKEISLDAVIATLNWINYDM